MIIMMLIFVNVNVNLFDSLWPKLTTALTVSNGDRVM